MKLSGRATAHRGHILMSLVCSIASVFEVDDVIDPADSRRWIMGGLRSLPAAAKREGKKRAWVDTW